MIKERTKKLLSEGVRVYKRLLRREIKKENLASAQPLPWEPRPVPYANRPGVPIGTRRSMFGASAGVAAVALLMAGQEGHAFSIANSESGLSVRNKLNSNINVISITDPTYGATTSADATVAIQAAFNAAFGTTIHPHGGTVASGIGLNVPIYIPAGTYPVSAPTAMTVTGASRGSSTPTEINGTISGTSLVVNTVNSGPGVAIGQEVYKGSQPTGLVVVSGSGTSWTLSGQDGAYNGTATCTLYADIIFTVGSTTGFVSGQMVNTRGMTTVSALSLDGSAGIVVLSPTQVVFIGTSNTVFGSFTSWTNGGTITGPALNVRSVQGGHIFGAGRESSVISCANGSVFGSNGFAYSKIERLNFAGPSVGYTPGSATPSATDIMCCLDLNWDNTGSGALQSCTLQDVNVGLGDYGIRIGAGGAQGSEISILNCFPYGNGQAGVLLQNQNALQITIVGGNMQGCYRGTWSASGVINTIIGTGFQVQGDTDIYVGGSGGYADRVTVINVRSESHNFITSLLGVGVHLIGCGHTGTNGDAGIDRTFAAVSGVLIVDDCNSEHGLISGNGGCALSGSGNRFANPNWNSLFNTSGVDWSVAYTQGFDAARQVFVGFSPNGVATFASLPPAHANGFGAMSKVFDGLKSGGGVPAIGDILTGGGSTKVMAYCNGTNWVRMT